jgi:hypothetical protein
MGLNLFVWHESAPISADDARTKIDRWAAGDTESFAHRQEVSAFRDAVLRRFPQGDSVWKSTPPSSDQLVTLPCSWIGAALVSAAAVELAAEHSLVCYEPAANILNPNAPGYVPRFVLSTAGVPEIPDPDAQRLDWAVRRLNDRNHYAILDRADGRFAQVGYQSGTWALEFAEDSLFAARTADVTEAVRFLQDYLADDHARHERHTWRRVELG